MLHTRGGGGVKGCVGIPESSSTPCTQAIILATHKRAIPSDSPLDGTEVEIGPVFSLRHCGSDKPGPQIVVTRDA